MSTLLEELAQSDQSWVAIRANAALQLTTQFKLGNISPDEYRELLADLIRTDSLNKESSDINMKSMLVTAIRSIATFV
jgi:hypothetical protein